MHCNKVQYLLKCARIFYKNILICEKWNCALGDDKQIFKSSVSFNTNFLLIEINGLNLPTLKLFLLLKFKFSIGNVHTEIHHQKNIQYSVLPHCIDVVTLVKVIHVHSSFISESTIVV